MTTAEILPFPPRAPAATRSPEERLRRALAELDAALDEQRAAVAEFRSHLGELGGAVSGLEDTLLKYVGQLTTTESDVLAAQESARKLEATADVWMQRLSHQG
jgi:chromosome segregation ATPase